MRKHGFTLIELLVVIAIIGILAAILVPAINTMMRRAAIVQTQADLQALVTAWKTYFNEYNRWPVDGMQCLSQNAAENGSGVEMRSSVLFKILHPPTRRDWDPDITKYNPRRIHFLTYDEGSIDTETLAFVDAWGNTNRCLFDVNFDGKIVRPTETIYDNVIAWSLGPDGVESDDDVKSWSSK